MGVSSHGVDNDAIVILGYNYRHLPSIVTVVQDTRHKTQQIYNGTEIAKLLSIAIRHDVYSPRLVSIIISSND